MSDEDIVRLLVSLDVPRARFGRVTAFVDEMRAQGWDVQVSIMPQSEAEHVAIVEPRRHLGPEGQALVENYLVRCQCGWRRTFRSWDDARIAMREHHDSTSGDDANGHASG